jgi:hypothetical protein
MRNKVGQGQEGGKYSVQYSSQVVVIDVLFLLILPPSCVKNLFPFPLAISTSIDGGKV